MDTVGNPQATGAANPGDVVRRTRRALGMTLEQLGSLTGYSAAQVSRLERGKSAMTDLTVLQRFAQALTIHRRRSASYRPQQLQASSRPTSRLRRIRA
ncbi:helix-turn-helix transcriptional regulator [Streptomyces sp. NPDC005180]|uniref:helix-turn-helix domain-containing protein n=1 Tax=Streptomyces sp. NPDC005180 TaxID=3156868 RepID=UPI0033B16D9F